MMMKKIAHIVFWMICGGLSIYATYRQFKRYFENADAPVISFTPFNESPGDDVYPDVTFCFSEIPKGSGSLYDNAYLAQQHSLTKKEYQSLLIGDEETWKTKPNESVVSNINFDNVTTTLEDVIVYYYVTLVEGASPLTRGQVMARTFQIPGKVCFTRSFEKLLGHSLVTVESFKMRLSNSYVTVFVHYPGNVLRTVFGMDWIWKSSLTVTKANIKEVTNKYELMVTQMNVLKKRKDAVKPCDPTPTDDTRFWNELHRRLDCIPSFWKPFFQSINITSKNVSNCNSFIEFKRIQDMIWTNPMANQVKVKENIFSSFIMPCDEMGIIVGKQEKPKKECTLSASKCKAEKNDATLKISYRAQKYQEVRNVRDFGVESLLSYIGGYVGIFVGYSLLNLLDDFFGLIEYFFKVTNNSALPGPGSKTK